MVVVLKAFVERCVSLVLGHPFEFPWLEVSQTDIFHCSFPRFSPLGGSQQPSVARWIVHPIVVAHRKNRQQRRTIFVAIRDASRENGAPVPAAPGRALSHTKHGLPESALICDTGPHGKNRGETGDRGETVDRADVHQPPLLEKLGNVLSVHVLGRPTCGWACSAASSTCTTGASCAMRFTEHRDTPVSRATSVLRWPGFNKVPNLQLE
jgi:hypothetical protein